MYKTSRSLLGRGKNSRLEFNVDNLPLIVVFIEPQAHFFSGFEERGPFFINRHRFSRAWITANAGGPVFYGKSPKPA